MYKTKSHIISYLFNSLLFLFVMAFMISGCDVGGDDPDNGDPGNGNDFTGESETYELQSTEVSDVSGIAVFEELTDGSTLITLELNGTEANAEHPAHIHANSAAEGGGINVSLNAVDGSSGSSETTVASLDDDTPISYNELISYDGHVMVHLSEDELQTVISRGDIGGNALTGTAITYELHETNDSGISGNVHFEERNNENTLVTIELMGTSTDGDHPAHIHDNSVADGGGVAVPLNNVDGETGLSLTNIRADETAAGNLTYSALLEFDGHVNVHLSGDDIATIIAQGDIGANYGEETGNANGENGTNDGNGGDSGNGDDY